MSTQMNGIQAENFIPSFQYDNQTAQGQMHHQQMSVHVGNNHNHEMFIKQEITSTPNFPRPPQSKFESYVSMSAPVTPSTPRNESPSQTPNTAPPDRKIDNRPAFSSFHSSPYPSQTHRKRRDNAVGFPQDAGPFFTQTQQHYPLYTIDRSTNLKARINSKVDRGFFLADNDWTCYRRNYFQISSAFSISSTPHPVNESDVSCLIEVDGQYYAVTQFLLGITARVSNSDKKIELVQHTPKRDKGPQMVPGPKPIRPGGNLNLSSVGTNSNIVTFERIQFKTATANNGKRRAAQQYYVLMVDLYAQVETGEPYRLATTTSAPLVVRGRSPGHYADNHERYNSIQMHPTFPNDNRHIPFTGPNGTPGMMPGDFNGPFSSPYGQYPPPFQGFPPGSLMMATGPPNSTHDPFHPHHPSQHYMVQNMQETGDNSNPEMYNNGNIDPNNMEGSNASTNSPGGSKPFMKIEIPPQSSHIPDHPLTSPAYHSQEFVEGLHQYNGQHNNGQPANTAATHNGGYHSDSEQHRSNSNNNNNNNGFNKRQDIISQQSSSNSQQNNSASTTISSSSPSSTNPSAPATTTATANNPSATTSTNSELNNEKTSDTDSNDVGNKNPSKITDENSNHSTTTPTTELGKSLGQMNMNYGVGKGDDGSEKL